MLESEYVNKDFFKNSELTFAAHLKLNNNHRILFSAKFGAGKTTFLKYFFSKESKAKLILGKEYKAIHLFPVNYPVSSNEDIFELIKYDIIAHLFNDDEFHLENDDIPLYKAIPKLLVKKPADFTYPLLDFFGNTGKVYEKYMKLFEQLSQQYEEVNEPQALLTFLKTTQSAKGNIYENDFYTILIKKILERWKTPKKRINQEDEREIVLIIDDLDRIEPHQAFRLFNIFTAHFDTREDSTKNKFGFDKIIFVCDIKSIRNSFHHQYGSNAAFSGYIDKFYSVTPYLFNLGKDIESLSNNIVSHPKFFEINSEIESISSLKEDLTILLKYFLWSDAINLRSLMKTNYNSVRLNSKEIKISTLSVHNTSFQVVILMDILVHIVGSATDLDIVFQKCKLFQRHADKLIENYLYLLSDILVFLDYSKVFNAKENLHLSHISSESNIEIIYAHSSKGRNIGINIEKFTDESGKETEIRPNIFSLYQNVLSKLLEIDYFRY